MTFDQDDPVNFDSDPTHHYPTPENAAARVRQAREALDLDATEAGLRLRLMTITQVLRDMVEKTEDALIAFDDADTWHPSDLREDYWRLFHEARARLDEHIQLSRQWVK